MPDYIVMSAASLRGVSEITAPSPVEAIKQAAERRGGSSGRFLCIALNNVTYANAEQVTQTVAVTVESAADLSRTLS